MRQFESDMKARAHLRKIKNAKATLTQKGSKINQQRLTEQQDLMVLKLYEANQMSSIPIYKLLKPMGLQQYTRELIIRGYGVNVGKLAFLSDVDRQKLYEDIKVLPGHTTKLNRIIEYITNQAKELTDSGYSEVPSNLSRNIFVPGEKHDFMAELNDEDDYERQLERVLNEYTPKDSTKGQIKRDSKYVFKKEASRQGAIFESGVKETAYDLKMPKVSNAKYPTSSRIEASKKGSESVKKVSIINEKPAEKKSTISRSSGKDVSTKPTVKKESKAAPITSAGKALPTTLRNLSGEKKKKDKTQLEVDLKIDQIKTTYASVEGAVMTSTIFNLDLEEECHCIASYLQTKIKPAEKKKVERYVQQEDIQESQSEKGDIDELEVGNILRQSYLHPLYCNNTEVEQRIASGDDDSEVEEEIDRGEQFEQQKLETNPKFEESSFLGGHESVSFGLNNSLDIFEQPSPTEVDYYVPTIDSLSNFIKNIVVSAKMEREVPILAVLYVEKFVAISKMTLTSINYKRLIISCLLLASKVWDDQSFETPSFSHTFPDYSTVLLNELEKQVLVAIDYKLKLNKQEYAVLYYRLRQYRQPAGRSYQNRALNITRVLQLQRGIRKSQRSQFLTKRKSF